jgi:hypothetical protein
LVNTSLIEALLSLPDALLIPTTTARLQLNVTPVVALVDWYVNVPLLHIAAGVKLLVNSGFGFTITVTSCVLLQPFAVNVNLYTTLIGLAVVLIKVSVTDAELPLPNALLIPVIAALLHE